MALKIVYKICCGIDVHKTFVVACIASTDSNGVTIYEHHRFSTYTKGLKDLLQWLLKHNCKDVCMESTGKYWIPVYNVLENDCSIVLAHPKYVKAIRGKKTDKKDAKWISDLLQIKRKESFAELSHGFQYPVGKRCFGHLRQICPGDTGYTFGKSRRYFL